MLADPPHLLKRLGNNILDHKVVGVVVGRKNGGVLDRALMRDMVAIDGNAEYRLLHKIHPETNVEVNINVQRDLSRHCHFIFQLYTTYLQQGITCFLTIPVREMEPLEIEILIPQGIG